MDSGLGGVNTTVAQIEAQLENASWELLQTTIGAPADGYVPVVALTVGDRALQASSVMSFIVENKIAFVGMLSQNGPQDDKDRRSSRYRFRHPGCIYRAKISVIQKDIGQEQIATSRDDRAPTRSAVQQSVRWRSQFPDEMSRDSLRLQIS